MPLIDIEIAFSCRVWEETERKAFYQEARQKVEKGVLFGKHFPAICLLAPQFFKVPFSFGGMSEDQEK
jgi:hypothetical protein